ncbi:hypothetical protein ACJMK2_035006 [Sinanodonta woodiana]|uniref:Deoxynucleoside kinase domain-containing protein n=1 Tax=Sinanodonta woodiana TaxID=1069815 RepID=A0ABD3WTJ5_SINWO
MSCIAVLANRCTRAIIHVTAVNTISVFGGKRYCAKRSTTKEDFGGWTTGAFAGKMLGTHDLKKIAAKVLREDNVGLSLETGKKYSVSIEGNIGCGKTTLLEYFRTSQVVEAIKEPVEQWTNVQGHNALELLYKDPSRWSFTFNLYAQLTRVQMHTKKHEKSVKMLERSLHSTRYCFVENDFQNKVINGLEYAILTEWYNWLIKNHDVNLDLIVYLRADPKVCYDRIKKRSRKEESCVPYSLLEDLHNLHEDWLVHQTRGKLSAPVLILDANNEYNKMTEIYEEKRKQILCGFV